MLFRNSCRYPDDEVRRIVDLAAVDFDLARVAVHVKNCAAAYRGRAYSRVPRISDVPRTAAMLVTLRVGPPERYPTNNLVHTRRWVDEPYDDVPDRGFVEKVLGIAHGTPEYKAWWRGHRIWTVHRGGVQVNRVQRLVERTAPYGGRGSPLIEVADWREGLVALAAHEFNHIRQFQNRWPCSEVECERVAAKRLASFRAEARR